MASARKMLSVSFLMVMCVVSWASCLSLTNQDLSKIWLGKSGLNSLEQNPASPFGDNSNDQNTTIATQLVRQLLKTTKDPVAVYELLGLLESTGFGRDKQESEDKKCLSMTFTSSNCTMVSSVVPRVGVAPLFLDKAKTKSVLLKTKLIKKRIDRLLINFSVQGSASLGKVIFGLRIR